MAAPNPYLRARRAVHRVLFEPERSPLGRALDGFIVLLIVSNVAMVIAESVAEVRASWAAELHAFEVFSVIVFTVEYLARAWVVVESPQYAHPVAGRLRYLTTFAAVVDLVAVLPFFVPRLIPVDTRFVRALRLVRLVRVLKLGRRSESLALYARVFRAKRGDLGVTVAMLALLLVVASSLMYFIEHEAQPEAFASIPKALWWGIITMTTIGYGDVYPVTALGRVMGGVVALFGVAFFALPPSILVAGIMEEMQRKPGAAPAAAPSCPHCGKPLPPP
jgi:voltage-gated potassium channel